MSLQDALRKYFGFSQFKGNQEAIIASILSERDTFVIMPTGGGKSLCYQLPALLLEGTAIIISPLIALMKNQVDSIRSYAESDKIAHFLNSSLSRGQIREVKSDIVEGHTKLLYVAPETLTKQENLDFFSGVNVSFIAVDEAHCISEWGHDFRPEYRRIRAMIEILNKNIPVMALTATATPKVREDIVKTLKMNQQNEFVSSFNRDNLYYEVRPKGKTDEVMRHLVQFVKGMPGKSGIIYAQSRKATEDIAQLLCVNGIKSAPYHAGLDAKVRNETQDKFLMEDIQVIVATIAFGMGIDKPDVRYVIHYDIPKSIENYYQETGRAGRDGMEGLCIAFYSYKDIQKLEKFLRDKTAAEREMGGQLLSEMIAYAETTACRRKFLLHYFGEEYADTHCSEHKMCDNCKYPRERIEAKNEVLLVLSAVEQLQENCRVKEIVDFILGAKTKTILDFGYDKLSLFGKGAGKNEHFWTSTLHQALLACMLYKDIEQYGIIHLTPEGKQFIKSPTSFKITMNHDFVREMEEADEVLENGQVDALDETLFNILKDVRRRVAKKKNVPPFVVFQDPSLAEMATRYPLNIEEMKNIGGVSEGKARRYGQDFIAAIQQYVEENGIDRSVDFVMKSVANKSKTKVAIIQGVDKKIPLEDIARSLSIPLDEVLEEVDMIIHSGTKLNLDYYVDEMVDESIQEIIEEYFMEAETDSVSEAFQELKEDDVTLEEIQLMRLKFLSDMAN